MNKSQQYKAKLKEFQVKLAKKYLKIITLYPSVNDTFVFLGMHAIGKEILVNCDKNGTIMYQYKFANPIDSLGMVELGKVTVLEARANLIHIFDLSTHIKTQLNFNFMFEESDQSSIITFSQTKLICVVQQGRYNDNRFKITYFNGNINPQSQPIAVYQSDSEWNYEYLIKKGNENSMIIWYKPRQDQQFELKEFHLEGVNPKYNHYICPNTIGQPYGKQKFQIAIMAAWQKSKSEFYLICITEKSNYNHENNEIINNKFVWNVVDNKIRETKFHFNQQYSQLLIDIYSFGKFSVFHTYSFHNGAPQSSPVYYLNNQQQKLAAFQRQWMCTYLTKICFPSYQTNFYVQSDYQNADVNKFKMRIIEIIEKGN